jgi:hypothetical protein
MADMERQLRHALVAHVSGNRPLVSCDQVRAALVRWGIPTERFSVHLYQPEDFLIVFAAAEFKNRVLAMPSLEFQGFSLFFKPWTRFAQASRVNMRSHVQLVLEGVPVHAWDREIAEELLGTSCVLEGIAPETRSRSDLGLFKVSAWASDLEKIPTAWTLVIPEPEQDTGRLVAREEVATLRYKVLIHVDRVEVDEPPEADWRLGNLPGSDRNRPGAAGRRRLRRFPWQRRVEDRRHGVGGGGGGGAGSGGSGQRTYCQVAVAPSDWGIPEMEGAMESHRGNQEAVHWPVLIQRPNVRTNEESRQLGTISGKGGQKQTSQTCFGSGTQEEAAPVSAPVRIPGTQLALEKTLENDRVLEIRRSLDHDNLLQADGDSSAVGGGMQASGGATPEGFFSVLLSEGSAEGNALNGDAPRGSPTHSLSRSSVGANGGLAGEPTPGSRSASGRMQGVLGDNPSSLEDRVPIIGAHGSPSRSARGEGMATQSVPRGESGVQESQAMTKIKSFCANILKTLAPPLLKEIESSNRLSAAAEPFTP